VHVKIDFSGRESHVVHRSSSNFIWAFIRFERSLRFSDLYFVLLIKNMLVFLSEIKIVNSL